MTTNQQDILCMLAFVSIIQGRGKHALDLLRLVESFAPNNIEMLRSMAYALILENQGDEAAKTIEKLARLDLLPESELSILLLKSRTLLVQKRLPEARALFQVYVRQRGA